MTVFITSPQKKYLSPKIQTENKTHPNKKKAVIQLCNIKINILWLLECNDEKNKNKLLGHIGPK